MRGLPGGTTARAPGPQAGGTGQHRADGGLFLGRWTRLRSQERHVRLSESLLLQEAGSVVTVNTILVFLLTI